MTVDTPAKKLPLQPADLRGLMRLGVDAGVGITDLVENMHHTIASRAGLMAQGPEGRTGGITGFVYRTVRGAMRLCGQGADRALGLLPTSDAGSPPWRERETLVAALNGVWGDHLAASGNPLAIRTALRIDGHALDLTSGTLAQQLPGAGPRLLVLAHGLCMGDLQWQRQGHDHGRALARDAGFTPVYLHYNSGLHVWQNGQALAGLLESLVAQWPVPLQELVILGHSMGGLVARSACHHAACSAQAWLRRLDTLVLLGAPHHGAPLERAGRWVDAALDFSPYVAPFARLGKARSAGITDLRFGNVQAADIGAGGRHRQHRDERQPTPLPAQVKTFLVAATLSQKPGRLHSTLVGDGLVPVASALGEHKRPAMALDVPRTRQRLFSDCGHLDLLNRADVYAQLLDWLRPAARPS